MNWISKPDGVLRVCENGCGDIQTRERYQDFTLHVEWKVPYVDPDLVHEQQRGNSGIYLQGRYELQVLDSWKTELKDQDDAGSIYGVANASENAALPPETWQTYDIDFQAARFDASGTKIRNAIVTVRWNGKLVQDHLEIPHSTQGGAPESPEAGPIRLQDHGDPYERAEFRNITLIRR